jgi:hypothetical protein
MFPLGPVEFGKVLSAFHQGDRIGGRSQWSTSDIAERNLEAANAAFDGMWQLVELNAADVDQIILPWHTSEGGGIPLVPKRGATVCQAIGTIRRHAMRYERACPVCWAKIHRAAAFVPGESPIFLSRAPLSHLDDYREVTPRAALFHLDGLHRMLAWRLFRTTDLRRFKAYVAGVDL